MLWDSSGPKGYDCDIFQEETKWEPITFNKCVGFV